MTIKNEGGTAGGAAASSAMYGPMKGTAGAAGAIRKINSFLKFGSVLGLERMNELLCLLGNPQDDLKVIHVAGTNGKGSTCRYLYCTLQAAGYRTGLYTSPYLEVFNERIEVDGRYISDEDLSAYTDRVLEQVKVMTDSGQPSPTEFEVVTAIAFLYYKEQNCDYVVLEVGLGGRGDSTNVVRSPLSTIITSISFDHMDRLGNTLTEIAGEKAGIIKDGCPVIASTEGEEALAVIRKTALDHDAPYYETKDTAYEITQADLYGYRFHAEVCGRRFEDLEISMIGEHQIKNAIGALTALCVMEERGDVTLTKEAIYEGFRTARQPGRLEVRQGPGRSAGTAAEKTDAAEGSGSAIRKHAGNAPVVLIDGAHNEDGARALAEAVRSFLPGSRILMVTGILADKDVKGVLEHFTDITKDFIVTEPDNPRKMTAAELASRIEALGGSCIQAPDPEDAVRIALERAGALAAAEPESRDGSGDGADGIAVQPGASGNAYDAVVFAGSLYLIGRVRTILRNLR